MIQELLKNPAFAELYKNATEINVEEKQKKMPSDISRVSTPVANNMPSLPPPNNGSKPKKTGDVFLIIAGSIIGGLLIYQVVKWNDNRKKNKKILKS